MKNIFFAFFRKYYGNTICPNFKFLAKCQLVLSSFIPELELHLLLIVGRIDTCRGGVHPAGHIQAVFTNLSSLQKYKFKLTLWIGVFNVNV